MVDRLVLKLMHRRFPDMFTNVGVANSAGIVAALLVVASLVPVAVTHWKGHKMRGNMSARM
jgi:hypothetical protein